MTPYELHCRAFQAVARIAINVLNWDEPKQISGPGSLTELPALVKSLGLRRVLLVTDPGLMKLGLPEPLLQGFESIGVFCAVYSKTVPNPTYDNIEEAFALYKESKCEAIVAFGGGSSMDCAKMLGARAEHPDKPLEKMKGLRPLTIRHIPPLFAVPTTAGTGSETTIVAVMTDPATHTKHTVMSSGLRPKYAVLDPKLTMGLPPHITAQTGMDAMTHAVEAYIGRSNTKYTAEKARSAVQLIFQNLETAVQDGKDLEARGKMLQASYDAGVAFTRAYVGYVHGIAHAIGGLYNVPHGLACAVALPYLLDYYGEKAYARLAELADAAGIGTNAGSTEDKGKAMIQAIRDLNAGIGIPAHFDCIEEQDVPEIARRALKESNPMYPVPRLMGQSVCEEVVRGMMKNS